MFVKELEIKDSIIQNLEEKLYKAIKENKELKFKLRIPRHHLEFLE
jgi:hypothetical protein